MVAECHGDRSSGLPGGRGCQRTPVRAPSSHRKHQHRRNSLIQAGLTVTSLHFTSLSCGTFPWYFGMKCCTGAPLAGGVWFPEHMIPSTSESSSGSASGSESESPYANVHLPRPHGLGTQSAKPTLRPLSIVLLGSSKHSLAATTLVQ